MVNLNLKRKHLKRLKTTEFETTKEAKVLFKIIRSKVCESIFKISTPILSSFKTLFKILLLPFSVVENMIKIALILTKQLSLIF